MFWDNVAGVYDVFVNVVNAKTHRRLKEIVAGQIGYGDTVLECACGTGMLSAVIAPKCKELTATDFSPKMLAKAKKNCAAFGNITFAAADITALPFADSRFDKVVAGNVIHLLDNPLTALKELDRVVKPGGTLIIPTYMNRHQNGSTSHRNGKEKLFHKKHYWLKLFSQKLFQTARSTLSLQNLFRGILGVHLLNDTLEDAVLVKDESAAERTQDRLSVHFLLSDGAEGLVHFLCRVGKEREGQRMFGCETGMGIPGVLAYAYHVVPGGAQCFPIVPDGTGLGRTTGRMVLGIEINDGFLSFADEVG